MSKNVVLMLLLVGLTCAMEGDRKPNLKFSLLTETNANNEEQSLDENNKESNESHVSVSGNETNIELKEENTEPISCIICYDIEKAAENRFLFTRNCEMGHGPLCKVCLRKLFENGNRTGCPICRKEVNALEYTFIRDEMEERESRDRRRGRICRFVTSLVSFCTCNNMIRSALLFILGFYVIPKIYNMIQNEMYLACPHPVSIVPAKVMFSTENGRVCLTSVFAKSKMCFDSISRLIKKCVTDSNSCTTEVQKQIYEIDEDILNTITYFKPTPTAEFPSGFKLTNGVDNRGFKVTFSGEVAQNGCVDRCNAPSISCGSLTEMKVSQNLEMHEWDKVNFLKKNSWTITFPHIMKYQFAHKYGNLYAIGGSGDPKILIEWSTLTYNWNQNLYVDIYNVHVHDKYFGSGGTVATGKIFAYYFSGQKWYQECKKVGNPNWENRCKPDYLAHHPALHVLSELGGMKWVAYSTFENWDPVTNGVTETKPSGQYNDRILVLKRDSNSNVGTDQLIKIVNKNSVDPMAFATLYVARYYNAFIKKEYIDAQNKICDEGDRNCDQTKIRKNKF